MTKIAVLASGNGSNFEEICNYKNDIYKVELLICNKKDAYVIERANKHAITTLVLELNDFVDKESWETAMINELKKRKIKWVILAGFMKILSSQFIAEFRNKIINIHPSILPNYPGMNGIEQAYESQDDYTGITIHYVDEGVDTGKHIFQKSCLIKQLTLSEVKKEVHNLEHYYYPRIIQKTLKEENNE